MSIKAKGTFMISTENNIPPFISVVGTSGSGKTTLLEKLIPELIRRGLTVGTVKHHLHKLELDRQGKDSWRHKQAGAAIAIVSSPTHIGMVMDVDHDHHPSELTPLLSGVDIILIEGYKNLEMPKLEVFRPEICSQPILKDDKNLLALVTDTQFDLDLPRFSTEDVAGLADFLIERFELKKDESGSHRKTETF
jgi:molybdopterin-guanine dinucleotide biosynthesis protein B